MRGQPDCDQTADEQQVQDKDDAQSACRSHAARYRDLAGCDASPTQAGVAPSSACVRGSIPQHRAPSLDQDETAATNLPGVYGNHRVAPGGGHLLQDHLVHHLVQS
jgi:hypothetical protein